ncbi:MAG TPA: hypothetical protein DIW24_06160 [Bacteroidetes bacterium]|nr:hypothetical protein [Bacteroidota bacterium]
MFIKKRIIIFSLTPLGIGGMEENILQLAEGLQTRFEVKILGWFTPPFLIQAAARLPKTELLPIERPSKYNFLFGLRLLKLFRRLKPDLVHFQDPRSRLLGGPITNILGIKSVYTFHMSPLLMPHSPFKARVYTKIEKLYNRHFTDALIFVSKNVKDFYARLGLLRTQKPNDFVIRNGIDSAPFLPLLAEKQQFRTAVRTQLQVLPETRLVLGLGRLTVQKGFDYLIQAIALLPSKGLPPFKIILLGDGEARAQLHALAKTLEVEDALIWLGFQDKPQVREYLIAADLFVLPSRYECYPYSILEANAAQIPVLVSDVGGSAEAAALNANHTVIPPHDPMALANALAQALQAPLRVPNVVKTSLDDMLAQTRTVYDLLLDR